MDGFMVTIIVGLCNGDGGRRMSVGDWCVHLFKITETQNKCTTIFFQWFQWHHSKYPDYTLYNQIKLAYFLALSPQFCIVTPFHPLSVFHCLGIFVVMNSFTHLA